MQRGARRHFPRQVGGIEDGGTEREDALIEYQLLLQLLDQLHGKRSGSRGIQGFLRLTEILGQDEGLKGAGDDQLAIRI